MVRVLVDHDLIASPVPSPDDVVIVRGDVPVEIAKPEAFPVSSCKHKYMLGSKAAGEVSVCQRLIEVVMRIVGATVVSDPLIVLGVNVRHFRMTFLVHGNVVLGAGLLTSCRGRRSRRAGASREPDREQECVHHQPAEDRRHVTPPRALPAKAATQIKTISPIIFFMLALLGNISTLTS